ncbi:MAG TPA: hypothetical protein VF365_02695 [Candidatus Limnocylindria bacterium]
MVPLAEVVPAARGKVPTPEIVTVMLVGSQSALSTYRTLNRILVDGEPLPGDALPRISVISWDLPLQLAARTGVAVGSSTTQEAARRSVRRTLMI